jgi:hypothetical protein
MPSARIQGQKRPYFIPFSRKVKKAKGLSRSDLCALCLLFVPLLVFIPGGSKGEEDSILIE